MAKSYPSRKVLNRLKSEGWQAVQIKGSHHQFKHSNRPGRVTVPHPER